MTEGIDDPAAGPAPEAGVERPSEAEQLFIGQVRLVVRNVPVALPALIVNAGVLTYVLWGDGPSGRLVGWLVAVLGITGMRGAISWWYRGGIATHVGARRWAHWYLYSTALSGVLWGAVALIVPAGQGTHRVIIAFLTGGLAAGSMAAYAPIAALPHAFILPATGLVTLSFLLQGDETSLIMAAMVALFAALLSLMARGVHATIRDALRLRTENRGLVSYLTDAKAHTEQLNEELKQEMRERGQAEGALRESEERFRSLVESATDGIGFTFEGRIYYANQAALDIIGYEAEEVLGLPIERFLADTTLGKDKIFERYEERIAGKEVPRQYETQMVRKDGTVLDVIFSNSLVSLDGKLGVMSIVKDITERKRAEMELRAAKETAEEATRLKDQFVSLLAHDLRAPLNSVFSMITLLNRDPERSLSADQQSVLKAVSEQGEATLRMIEDLLNVSRLHTGKLKPERRFVDASAITTTAVSLLKHMAAEKRIALADEVPHQTRLFTDPEMFGKVIYNLLSNAIKFCRRGDRIRLHVPPGRPGTVTVEDSGPGVDAKLVQHLFRHDIKTSTPGSAGERGTGLGLPLSQDIMHALGGEIRVESTPGQGAAFHATLPLVRPKVLVVGRDESLSLFVRPHLESIDAEFLEAADGEEAALKLETEGVHLVIAEASLAGNGGFSLLRRIREAPRGRSVPLMVITDNAEAGLMEQGYRLGADDIVVKPLVPNDFLLRLRRFIN